MDQVGILSIQHLDSPNTDAFLVVGPIVGGFVTQYLGWRWMNWLAMIFSGVSVVLSLLMKETYSPVILQKKAAKLREETGESRWWSRYDQKMSLAEMLRINLGRPFVMAVTEPIWYFLPANFACVNECGN